MWPIPDRSHLLNVLVNQSPGRRLAYYVLPHFKVCFDLQMLGTQFQTIMLRIARDSSSTISLGFFIAHLHVTCICRDAASLRNSAAYLLKPSFSRDQLIAYWNVRTLSELASQTGTLRVLYDRVILNACSLDAHLHNHISRCTGVPEDNTIH